MSVKRNGILAVLLRQPGVEDGEIRALSLETLREHRLLAIASIFWTQVAWFGIVLVTGWTWVFAFAAIDAVCYSLRLRARRGPSYGRSALTPEEDPSLALHWLAQIVVCSTAIFLLTLTPSDRAAIYALVLTSSVLGYVAVLCAAFPNLGMVCIVIPAAALSAGLALGPSDLCRPFAIVAVSGSACFIILLRQNYTTILGALGTLQAKKIAALHDPLTQLPNRTYLREVLSRQLSSVGRPGGARSIAVLCLDLDGFKSINDRYGHAAGDCVLIEAAAILRTVLRPDDIASRIGGDEFVVILREMDAREVEAVARAVIASITHGTGIEKAFSGLIGVSIGAAIVKGAATSFDAVLEAADAALYEAKRAGKGCLRFSDRTDFAQLAA